VIPTPAGTFSKLEKWNETEWAWDETKRKGAERIKEELKTGRYEM
jgi:hypothetical protein